MILIFFSFLGSFFPAILCNVPRRNILLAGFAGMIGMLIKDQFSLLYPDAAFVSVFLGSSAVAVYSEIMARLRKTPATIFSIPGIFPLVPGVDAYRTIQLLSEQNYAEATAYGVATAAKASLIAFGILIVSAVFRKINKQHKR
ncbi:MAG: threonine/serine exporter family protein [Ruminiclostridium sp.]|nr:threonine/serine exporter family protein [Ruminiclostridium sp.]